MSLPGGKIKTRWTLPMKAEPALQLHHSVSMGIYDRP